MKAILNLLIAALSLFIFTDGFAGDSGAEKICSQPMEIKALDVAGTIREWDALFKAYSDFKQCDDGAIAEGFTESVVKMLADDWKSISKLAALVKRDRRFLDFVYRHINESADPNDLEKILVNVKSIGCKNITQSICKGIKQRASAALKAM
jgi:hypothetical protein